MNRTCMTIQQAPPHYLKQEQELQLNDTKRRTNGETSCELCGYQYEDSEHYFLHCTAVQETRINIIGLQQPCKENFAETISDFLLFKENSDEIINRNRVDLQRLCQHRLKIIHNNGNQNQTMPGD